MLSQLKTIKAPSFFFFCQLTPPPPPIPSLSLSLSLFLCYSIFFFPLYLSRINMKSNLPSITKLETNEKQDILVECECGQILEKGWNCDTCRMNCPGCNRALSIGEYCTRCYIQCQQHGLMKLSDKSNRACSQCSPIITVPYTFIFFYTS